MNSSKYSSHRPSGREHMPLYPRGFIALRVVQLILALVILGLCAYSLTLISFSGNALSLFAAVATLIITVYCIVAHFGPAVTYNYWAILALDIFGIVFWIASFALLASQVAPWMDGVTICDYDYDCATYALVGTELIVAACLCAAAGLGGVEFILFIVSLAIHSVMMHRHRSAGLHNRPVSPQFGTQGAFPTAGPVQAEKAQPVHNVFPQPQYAGSHHTAVATPSPVQGQQMYQPPPVPSPSAVAQPNPYNPQQQQGLIQPQHTGANFGAGQVPGPHVGSYEAQGQPVSHQQQYHPTLGPN
ncbi:hypothetical protein J7T55_004003 [Diaporthe amygdali]|uniref:uncharacterized protein n=1 Tax=Phomopsis amygdali TaxID=1214568 RepID=UPI0022FF14B0|nr:uncharacterized protein J7T55_004003 [Diaporthe amygdali]KAJ0115834.1 hypothetical protein J7T55_004003 [Diaporthe amygdali]